MAYAYTGFVDEAQKTLQGQIDVLKKLGWSAIELRLVDGRNFCDATDQEFDAAWDKLQSEGIKIAGFGSQLCNWARPITSDYRLDVEELERNIPRMRKSGCKIIRCMSYPNDPKNPLSMGDWKAEAVKRLGDLARRCAAADVILGHENCSGYGGENAERTFELIEAVDCPAFKVIFDTGNTTAHDKDPEATWRYYEKVKDHICHIHIKAYKKNAAGEYQTCYPDEDPVQMRLLKAFKEDGYEGYISIEPHMKAAVHAGKDIDDDPQAATDVFVEYGKRIMKMTDEA